MNNLKELTERELFKRLEVDNPWWRNRTVPKDYVDMAPRPFIDVLYPSVVNLKVHRAPILMGPRRVGKTVMLYHVIDRLINSGIDSEKIFYFSLDTPIYGNIGLERLFNYARENRNLELETEGFFVFFDEIQYLKDWEQHLKSLVDTYRHCKFIASGSAAAALKMKSSESGAGRFSDFKLPPLTFAEFLKLKGLDGSIARKTDLPWGKYDTTDIVSLNHHFIDYINYGGYPEVAFSDEIRAHTDAYVKNDIVEKVLMRDLPSLYGVSDTQELNRFFAHLAFRSGDEVSYQSLSTDTGIRKETIKKYLEYLEAAFLIKVLNRIDCNAKRMQRVTTFKVYLTNPILRSALFSPIEETDDAFGSIVETALVAQWLQGDENNFYYANWNKGREKGEVDMVWTNPATQQASFATEVKLTDRFVYDPSGLKSLGTFLAQNKHIDKTLVTSKTQWGECSIGGKLVVFIPAALYAYNVSRLLAENK